MQILFTNSTTSIAYIGIIDRADNYIGDPIIFQLEPGHRCIYNTTPLYYIAIVINNKHLFDIPWLSNATRHIICVEAQNRYYDNSSYGVDHQVHGPDPKIIDNEISKSIETYVFDQLRLLYEKYPNIVDIKEPEM